MVGLRVEGHGHDTPGELVDATDPLKALRPVEVPGEVAIGCGDDDQPGVKSDLDDGDPNGRRTDDALQHTLSQRGGEVLRPQRQQAFFASRQVTT